MDDVIPLTYPRSVKVRKRQTMATAIRNVFTRSKSTTAKIPPPDITESLFPAPTRFPPSALSPHALPGTSPEAEQTLLEVLKHNHQKNHIFFNEKGFHK
jgi:hypothetical protein